MAYRAYKPGKPVPFALGAPGLGSFLPSGAPTFRRFTGFLECCSVYSSAAFLFFSSLRSLATSWIVLRSFDSDLVLFAGGSTLFARGLVANVLFSLGFGLGRRLAVLLGSCFLVRTRMRSAMSRETSREDLQSSDLHWCYRSCKCLQSFSGTFPALESCVQS